MLVTVKRASRSSMSSAGIRCRGPAGPSDGADAAGTKAGGSGISGESTRSAQLPRSASRRTWPLPCPAHARAPYPELPVSLPWEWSQVAGASKRRCGLPRPGTRRMIRRSSAATARSRSAWPPVHDATTCACARLPVVADMINHHAMSDLSSARKLGFRKRRLEKIKARPQGSTVTWTGCSGATRSSLRGIPRLTVLPCGLALILSSRGLRKSPGFSAELRSDIAVVIDHVRDDR